MLGRIAIEIRRFNAIKKTYIFCFVFAITAFGNSREIFYTSDEQVVGKSSDSGTCIVPST